VPVFYVIILGVDDNRDRISTINQKTRMPQSKNTNQYCLDGMRFMR